MRLDAACAGPDLEEELREYLEGQYQIIKLELVDEAESDAENEITVSLQLQLIFDESQMVGDEPADESLGELGESLRGFLEAKYPVNYLEILDDSLKSYLLAEREEPDEPG